MTTQAQQAANQRQNKKRAAMARLPTVYLSDEENRLFQAALKKHGGTKKALIMDSIKFYMDS